jgi:hypothetical protein
VRRNGLGEGAYVVAEEVGGCNCTRGIMRVSRMLRQLRKGLTNTESSTSSFSFRRLPGDGKWKGSLPILSLQTRLKGKWMLRFSKGHRPSSSRSRNSHWWYLQPESLTVVLFVSDTQSKSCDRQDVFAHTTNCGNLPV